MLKSQNCGISNLVLTTEAQAQQQLGGAATVL